MAIESFTGDYAFLSNTYPVKIMVSDTEFNCVESAYWAMMVKNENARTKMARLKPSKAKAKALNMEKVDNWDEIKYPIMKNLLAQKFSNKELAEKLIATRSESLVNNVTYMDEEYGVRNGQGKNLLGKFLMEIRSGLQTS